MRAARGSCPGTFLVNLAISPSYTSPLRVENSRVIMDATKDESIVVGTDHDQAYLENKDDYDDNIDPSVPTQYRGTAADKSDMKVIGKTQVLRVRPSTSFYCHGGAALTVLLAQFQVRCHAGVCFNSYGQLGNIASVRNVRILCDMAHRTDLTIVCGHSF